MLRLDRLDSDPGSAALSRRPSNRRETGPIPRRDEGSTTPFGSFPSCLFMCLLARFLLH